MKNNIEGSAIIIAYISILFTYHRRRNDSKFIKLLYQNKFLIYLYEYIVFSTPLLLIIFISYNFKLLLLYLLIALVPLIPYKDNFHKSKIISYFWGKKNSFEWISGIRKSYILISMYYVASLSITIYSHFGILCFLIILSRCLYFYRDGESIDFLCIPELNTKKFLFFKIWYAVYCFHILSTPFYIIYLVFHSDYWYYLLVLSLSSIISFTFYILYKYANFQANEKNIGSDIVLSISFILSLIPFLFPLFLLIFFVLYKKSANKLNLYHHDFYK